MILNGLDISARNVPAEYQSIEGHGRVCIFGAHVEVDDVRVVDAGEFLVALDDDYVRKLEAQHGVSFEGEGYGDEAKCRDFVARAFSEAWIREQAEEWANGG